MNVFELIIDELTERSGVNAISLVDDPAIESNWITLSKQEKVMLKVADDERQVLLGAALIPNKPIYRRGENGEEYNIFFSSDTVRKASELFLKRGFQSETTLQHEIPLEGNSVVESWIKEDEKLDKSLKFGIEAPVGTWFVAMKIEDADTWKLAKEGKIRGFSIEGYFTDQAVKAKSEITAEDIYNQILNLTK
jgi:hypothetical protein